MGKDAYYARVQGLTEEALDHLSVLSGSMADFVTHYWDTIHETAARELSEEEQASFTNLSFFYFLGTCIDFLFLLHLRHRHVNIYQHELEHILSVMMTHARAQQVEFARDHDHAIEAGPAHSPGSEGAFNLVEFTRAVQRLKDKPDPGQER